LGVITNVAWGFKKEEECGETPFHAFVPEEAG
jgi:hypothetical protein